MFEKVKMQCSRLGAKKNILSSTDKQFVFYLHLVPMFVKSKYRVVCTFIQFKKIREILQVRTSIALEIYIK